jgi:hypothetical protein
MALKPRVAAKRDDVLEHRAPRAPWASTLRFAAAGAGAALVVGAGVAWLARGGVLESAAQLGGCALLGGGVAALAAPCESAAARAERRAAAFGPLPARPPGLRPGLAATVDDVVAVRSLVAEGRLEEARVRIAAPSWRTGLTAARRESISLMQEYLRSGVENDRLQNKHLDAATKIAKALEEKLGVDDHAAYWARSNPACLVPLSIA